MAVAAREADLRRLVDHALHEAGERPVVVASVERRPFDRRTSYALDLLRVRLATGRRLDVVVKDFGTSRLPKDDPRTRAERELAVYRDLLDDPALGTPRLYGYARDPVRLLLEHVPGTPLYDHGLATWVEAAAWIGAFQARMAARAERIARCEVLVRHDAAFFRAHARAARVAAAAFGPAADRRLGALLEGYARLVAVMESQPRTLVHGSFRPQNVVIGRTEGASVRICPVDWELAGAGSPLYDLAFLAEGFEGPKLEDLVAAYRRGGGGAGTGPVDEQAFVIDCFRLHKVLKSIGDALALGFRPATVDKLLGMAEGMRERLG